jgi:hypothetical protein
MGIGVFKSFLAKEEFEKKIVSLHFSSAKKGFIGFIYSLWLLIPRLYDPRFAQPKSSNAIVKEAMNQIAKTLVNTYHIDSDKMDDLQSRVEACISTGNREDLRHIAYHLFRENSLYYSEIFPFSQHYNLLRSLFEDDAAYLFDIALVMFKTFEECQKKLKENPVEENLERKRKAEMERPAVWEEEWSQDPEAWIEISHGGGYYYLQDFLTGKEKGYPLERGGLGIQVSPGTSDRDEYYALRGAPKHFDLPARLTGKIQAKYLDRANNAYEAGLRPEFVQHLEKVTCEKISYSKSSVLGFCPVVNLESLQGEYSSSQLKRFAISCNRPLYS